MSSNKKKDKNVMLEILCLEDSAMDADLIYHYLKENFSYEINMDVILDEKDFIAAIKSKKYNIILSDFNLPGFDGFKALEHAKVLCPTTPFICVSGYIGEETAVELLKQGAIDYVSKDKMGRLIFSIERALRETNELEEKKKRELELIVTNEKLEKTNKKILFLNHHDFLTGLYNRIYFELEKNRLDKENLLPISIIMGDINGLKLINDGFGHATGDKIILKAAHVLKSCCREKDIIARIGGDEFAILLPATDAEAAQKVCRRIIAACKKFESNDKLIYASVSIGFSTKIDKDELIDNTFRKAEESMSRQKLLESRSTHSAIISSIKATMFEKSHETAEHADRLVCLSKMIGTAMLLNDEQLNNLELVATLHDIGKMSIDFNILAKKTKLTDEEWHEMKKHPMVGFRIAQATSELIPIANYILCHHERWDGNGYPQGLAGEEIPLLSRIITLVDSYDAMTNDRIYRAAMKREVALEEIYNNSGSQFDPVAAEIFLKLMRVETMDSAVPCQAS